MFEYKKFRRGKEGEFFDSYYKEFTEHLEEEFVRFIREKENDKF